MNIIFFVPLICQFSFELSALVILIFHSSWKTEMTFFHYYYYGPCAQNDTFYNQHCGACNSIAE